MSSKKTITILKVIAINLLAIFLAFTVYSVGYEYDRTNKIYPEVTYLSYDFTITTCGQRWNRLSDLILILTVIFDFVVILLWYRKKQAEKKFSLFKIDSFL